MQVEEWRPVPGAHGYEASNLGRIRSRRRGEPKPMTSTTGPCGFPTITVASSLGIGRNARVGEWVAAAWLGPKPPHARLRHLDGDTRNDHLDNLAFGSAVDVVADYAARARRQEAAGAPTHCGEGHLYTDSYEGNWGQRYCRDCAIASSRAYYRDNYVRKPALTSCVDCGVDVPQRTGPGAAVKRCASCRRKAEAEWHRRYRAKAAKPPRVSECIECGVKITNRGPGPLASRCAPHKMLAAREADRRYRGKDVVA